MEIVSAVLSYEGVSMKLNASKQTVAGFGFFVVQCSDNPIFPDGQIGSLNILNEDVFSFLSQLSAPPSLEPNPNPFVFPSK